jgi:hypothetical protein
LACFTDSDDEDPPQTDPGFGDQQLEKLSAILARVTLILAGRQQELDPGFFAVVPIPGLRPRHSAMG